MVFNNLNNFRDFGGYQMLDGRRIKKNVLFRSDALCSLDDGEQRRLADEYGIKTVIDFRSSVERSSEPDLLPDTINLIYLTPKAELAELASATGIHKKRISTADRIRAGEYQQFYSLKQNMELMMRSFVNDPVNRTVYSEMLDIYCRAENMPVLQHCRGGKDRTGFGCMLMMEALGASKESVYQEYLLSNEYKKEEIAHKMDEYKSLTADKELLDNLYAMLTVQESYLSGAYDEIAQCFGSMEGFLRKGLNLTEEKQEQLKQLYLEL